MDLTPSQSNKLHQKIFYHSILGSILIAVIVAAVAIIPLYKNLFQQTLANFTFTHQLEQLQVEDFFLKLDGLADQITSRSRIRTALENYNAGKITLQELRDITISKLEDAILHADEIEGIIRYDQQGHEVLFVSRKDLSGIATDTLPERLITAQAALVNIRERLFYVKKAPIINRHQQRVGDDIVIFNLTRLEQTFRTFFSGQTEKYVFLTSTDQGKKQIFPDMDMINHYHRSKENAQYCMSILDLDCGLERDSYREITTDHGKHFALCQTLSTSHPFHFFSVSNQAKMYRNIYLYIIKLLAVVITLITVLSVGLIYLLKPLTEKAQEIQTGLTETIEELQEILPICMHCKNIRNEEGYWRKVESYIGELQHIGFSHGICDDCLKKFYPEQADEVISKRENPSKKPES